MIHSPPKFAPAHLNLAAEKECLADQGGGHRKSGFHHFLLCYQSLVDTGLSFSMVKTNAAAMSSAMRDSQTQRRPLFQTAPPWDLSLVLRALASSPFGPLDQFPLSLQS
ncbi:hypothetical protein Q8A73_003285 [Channa argus]|nr:hypothetical protein Q8A73_003285 [Channa argus]